MRRRGAARNRYDGYVSSIPRGTFTAIADPHNDKAPFDPAMVRYWLPVDQYIGGIVHAILHLLYTRFFCKVMRDLGLVNHSEPVDAAVYTGPGAQGRHGDVEVEGQRCRRGRDGGEVRMRHGRLYTLFAAPPEKDLEWSEESIEGAWRFLNRVFRLIDKHAVGGAGKRLNAKRTEEAARPADYNEKERVLLRKAHQTLKRVTADFETRWHFNSAIAQIMELVNAIYSAEPLEPGLRPEVQQEVLELVTLMLAPMTPHLAEELWEMLGHGEGLWTVTWPTFSVELAKEDMVEIPVQVNGNSWSAEDPRPGLRRKMC